jgi:hypothetical protein
MATRKWVLGIAAHFVFAELPVSGTLRDNDLPGLAQEKQKS